MRFLTTGLTIMFLSAASGADAADYLTEEDATVKAIEILKGDPYGDSALEVAGNIKSAGLVVEGRTTCAEIEAPVWSFRVIVPENAERPVIDGVLDLDAETGELVCASLPFLS